MPDPGAIYYSVGRLAAARRAALSNKSHLNTIQGDKTTDNPDKVQSKTIQDSTIQGDKWFDGDANSRVGHDGLRIVEGDMGFEGDIEGFSGHFGLEGNLEDFKTMEETSPGLLAEDLGMGDFDAEPLNGPRGDVYLTPESELSDKPKIKEPKPTRISGAELNELQAMRMKSEAHQEDIEQLVMQRVVAENIRNMYPEDKDYIKALEAVDRIYAITDDFPRHQRVSHLINFRWYRYLTLPEALLYHYLLKGYRVPPYFTCRLKILQEPTLQKPLIVAFSLIQGGNEFKVWHLYYDLNTLRVSVYEEDKQTGGFRFVIRNHRLEEVEGVYGAQRWTIDPVWSPSEEGVLKEEHVNFGTSHITLLHHGNELEGQWIPTSKESQKLKIHELPDFAEDKNKIVTAQHIEFGPYTLHIRLIFCKGVLIPVEGGMVVKKR